MRTSWKKLRWLGCLLLAVASCRNTPELKPPRQPENYSLPPSTDLRYSRPAEYPKDRFEDDFLKSKQDSEGPGAPGGRPGTPGVGRPY